MSQLYCSRGADGGEGDQNADGDVKPPPSTRRVLQWLLHVFPFGHEGSSGSVCGLLLDPSAISAGGKFHTSKFLEVGSRVVRAG